MAEQSPPSTETTERLVHPRAFAPATLILTVALSVLGAYIGLHLITTLGISANTSVVGALIAMVMGRVGIGFFAKFRSTNRQNLAQTAISSATFGAANALLTPMAIGWAYGRIDLVWPLLIGAVVGLGVDSWVLYRSFGSRFLPATAAWPPGIAAAETIKAGDKGGKRAVVLAGGGVVGAVLAWVGLSGSAAGVALIGNVVALLMFAVGLAVNQFITLVPGLADFSLSGQFIPHGVMIGAGIVALVQAGILLSNRRGKSDSAERTGDPTAPDPGAADPADADSVSPGQLRRALSSGVVMFLAGAVLLAIITGLVTEMSIPAIIGWAMFAAFAAFVHEIIVGLAAMHSGWFPAFAVTLIFLVIGLVVGLPEVPLVVLVGYCAATGPAFADMGYDLKAGWVLRKVHSRHPQYDAYERDGRRQQYYSAIVGFVVALVVVALLWRSYFEDGLIPPVAVVYADTITAGLTDPDAVRNLVIWAIPGAIIQAIGGPKRQMGVMLATGLLLTVPWACLLVAGALAIRLVVRKVKGPEAEAELSLVGAGLIAGDALASLGRVLR
ncbi:OPT family oligopeptide transporter [Occultella glacieicola]|uniref:OPT family oligopeptide transporter n=1 Tax=Occultella glacieicola TaxID=2518684 RepID=A0ABY2E3E4_9MICO|nr:OPT/YSL family transporter [Occultella glacieicola]TDE94152.1 OPT family oligopeptide transporter [Occultella glacieicola]